MKKPQVVSSVHLFKTGGRQGRIVAPKFKCPLLFEDELFECCLFLDQGHLDLGVTQAGIEIEFLHPELVVSRLKPGALFHLWEGKTIGYGHVEKVLSA